MQSLHGRGLYRFQPLNLGKPCSTDRFLSSPDLRQAPELAVTEELDRVEDETQVPIVLDVGPIAHFAELVEIKRRRR